MKQQTENIVSRFLRKTPLQMVTTLLERLPFNPIEVGLFFSLQVVGVPLNFTCEFNVIIREGWESDLEALTRCMDKRERFLNRFQKGDRCLLAFEGEEVAGFLWFSNRDIYEEELTGYQLAVPGNAVYSYDEYVSPTHRRKGILGQLFAVLYEWMGQCGKDTILILIFHDNDVSWQAHLKKGFTPINRILYMRVFGCRFYSVRPAVTNQQKLTRP